MGCDDQPAAQLFGSEIVRTLDGGAVRILMLQVSTFSDYDLRHPG